MWCHIPWYTFPCLTNSWYCLTIWYVTSVEPGRLVDAAPHRVTRFQDLSAYTITPHRKCLALVLHNTSLHVNLILVEVLHYFSTISQISPICFCFFYHWWVYKRFLFNILILLWLIAYMLVQRNCLLEPGCMVEVVEPKIACFIIPLFLKFFAPQVFSGEVQWCEATVKFSDF